MSTPLDAAEMLDREFLEIRARLLQVAAALDRVQRADGAVDADLRLERIRQALDILSSSDSNRAEQIQLVFSRTYEPDWKAAFKLQPAKS